MTSLPIRKEIKLILHEGLKNLIILPLRQLVVDMLSDAILAKIKIVLPKEKEFSPVNWGGVTMDECTDETFSIEKADGWNAYRSELINLLGGEK